MILLSQIALGIDVESKRKGSSFGNRFSLFGGTDRTVREGWRGVRKNGKKKKKRTTVLKIIEKRHQISVHTPAGSLPVLS
jgi:hypothetical protein